MTEERVPAEVEIKLEASAADDLVHIARLRVLGAFRLKPRGVAHLYSLYLDTRNFALARAGVALRLRRSGRNWEATAKWRGRVDGALHQRPELTVALPGDPAMPFTLPDGPLRTQLTAVVLGRRLAPIVITEVRRQLRDVLPGHATGGESLAELALDTVELHKPDGEPAGATYYEVEIEQRAGRTRDLKALASALQHGVGLVPSSASKFERGLKTLYGDALPSPEVEPIAAGDTVALAARKVVAAQLPRLRAADPGTRLGEPDLLHEQRVAIRRLRAAVRTLSAGIPPRLKDTLATELRWLGQELGAVRDLDVQLANLAEHVAHLGSEPRRCLTGFRRHLEHEREARRAALDATLNSRRYFQLFINLERFAAGPPPRHPRGEAGETIAAVGRKAVKRALRRLLKRGDAIGEVPDADDLHALRIRAKRLRYVLEALRPITGAAGRKLIKQLVRLQDVLGRFNDAMVAASIIRDYRDGPAATAAPAVRDTLSALADVELRRAGVAQSEFARTWRRFTSKAMQRVRRKLLARLKNAARTAPPATGAARECVSDVPGP